jgi:hypothetical protein
MSVLYPALVLDATPQNLTKLVNSGMSAGMGHTLWVLGWRL